MGKWLEAFEDGTLLQKPLKPRKPIEAGGFRGYRSFRTRPMCPEPPMIDVEDSRNEYRVDIEEHAAFLEYDGGLDRQQAEQQAKEAIHAQIHAIKSQQSRSNTSGRAIARGQDEGPQQ